MNRFNLSGRVALITGGSGALGGAMAKGLGELGCKLVVLGRTASTVDSRVEELKEEGFEALPLTADVLDRENLLESKQRVLSEWGRIDILINAAGGNKPGAVVQPDQEIFDLSIPDFNQVVQLNLQGTLLPTMVFGEVMAHQQKSGVILNISSMAAQLPLTRVMGYSAAKAAIDNFTRWLAVEMAQKYGEHIRVNALAPGFFIGEQNRSLLLHADGSYTDRAQTILSQTPMRRFGEAGELIGAVQWLCSDASKFVTGIVVPVDGGFSAFSGV
ncbi:SDR family oxidoreductase [Phaeodactylibacter xiamenensis]|uniref:SDR family oxidoreductase n=1 Tax=Phaeodactylibacter xiamenensis TaxID=1524460 RepID=UPI003BAA1E10